VLFVGDLVWSISAAPTDWSSWEFGAAGLRFEAGDAFSLVATSAPSRRRRGDGWSAVAMRGAQHATQCFVQVLERVLALSGGIQRSAQRVRARAH